ncbi:aminotransferase class III-fold pyridoxal phosphate-dependent enzyme [Streptomyces sp. enrichment culture]|uniref:aminotransferase class III-fold pyridoxal phosphate-dependent enzyme n=1 Tax=Streptomyces sp. enrichment culture TaxID=1795815 RepID=UPI003F5520EE
MRTGQGSSPRRQPAREPAARTYPRALPIVPVRARGMTIEGADGRRYLDCLSGAGALALGHNHPVVLEAIRKVLDSGAPLNALDLATPVKDAFVTELFRTLPPALADRARVRFCGPSATDALRTARELVSAAIGPTGLVGRDATTTRLAYPQDCSDLFEPVPGTGIKPEAAARTGARAARLPSGVIVEPVQGEGGVIPAPDAWLRRVRQLTADRSVPLIADETQTGVGRTGTFWAVQHSGVTPDVMILSEAVGGSLPLAAVVYRDDLDPGELAAPTGAFRGNQLAMAAGTATLAHVREHRLAERAAALGARMLRQLRLLCDEFDCVADVRGRGLMLGVELEHPASAVNERSTDELQAPEPQTPEPQTPEPPTDDPAADELAAAVQRECLRRGLIVGLSGRHANVVRLLPPLTVTDEQADAVLDRLTDAIRAASRAASRSEVSTPVQRTQRGRREQRTQRGQQGPAARHEP